MKIIRVDKDRYFNEKETPINVEGTDEQCFEKFYAFNRTYKYCNDVYFKFADKADKDNYDNWYKNLSETNKFNMYYGNSIVD